MLNAVLHGKTQGMLRQDYAGAFVGYEDSLTATIFERLLYLSQPRLEAILARFLKDAELDVRPADLGTITASAFWPTWPLREGGTKEPDVYVQFDRADLIVEAKRWDASQQQDFEQWAWEIKARPLADAGQRRLLLLAIGGLPEYDLQHVRLLKRKAVESEAFVQWDVHAADFDLLAASWRQFALILREQLTHPSLVASDQCILRDMLAGLALHDINIVEQRFFSQLAGDLTRLSLHMRDAALAAFRPNAHQGYFDAAWLQRTAAFRPIILPLAQRSL